MYEGDVKAQGLNDFLKNLERSETFEALHPEVDFGELETRMASSLKAPEVIEGEDIHRKMACAIFGLTHCDVREKHRQFAKEENFKQLYTYQRNAHDHLVYPTEPTHCRKCLKPLNTTNPQTFNVCPKCETY